MRVPSLRGAKRRSNPVFLLQPFLDCFAGACHRARIRATRWLAMTWRKPRHSHPSSSATGSALAPPDDRLQRAIQYSEASVMESISRGVLDTAHARGDGCGVD